MMSFFIVISFIILILILSGIILFIKNSFNNNSKYQINKYQNGHQGNYSDNHHYEKYSNDYHGINSENLPLDIKKDRINSYKIKLIGIWSCKLNKIEFTQTNNVFKEYNKKSLIKKGQYKLDDIDVISISWKEDNRLRIVKKYQFTIDWNILILKNLETEEKTKYKRNNNDY